MTRPQIIKLIGILAMGIILVVVLVFAYLVETHQPEILLDCKLPTERPMMDAPIIITPTLNTSNDALNYVARYLPQFNDSTTLSKYPIDESDQGDYYHFQTDNESVNVYPDGSYDYSLKDGGYTSVPEKEFPVEVARTCSTAFIESHGGLGLFEETNAGAATMTQTIGDHETTGIAEWTFNYHKRYDGYMICGFDRILVSIDPRGPVVSFYIHADYQLGPVNETRQVISAKEAWRAARNGTYILFNDDIKITNVELCYYIGRHIDNVTVMYPAWRFYNSEISIFVNAFTGIAEM